MQAPLYDGGNDHPVKRLDKAEIAPPQPVVQPDGGRHAQRLFPPVAAAPLHEQRNPQIEVPVVVAEHDLIRRAGKYLEYPDPFSRLPFPAVPGSILSSRRRSLEPENRHDSVSQREQPLDPARARPDERFRQIGQPDPVAGIRHREPVAIDIVPSRAFRIEQRLFPYFHSDRYFMRGHAANIPGQDPVRATLQDLDRRQR